MKLSILFLAKRDTKIKFDELKKTQCRIITPLNNFEKKETNSVAISRPDIQRKVEIMKFLTFARE